MAGAHPVYRKIVCTEEVLDQIANHAKTGAPPQQTLIHLCLSQSSKNLSFKNRDIYNEQ